MAEPPITLRARFSSFTVGDNLLPTRYVVHATCGGTGFPRESDAGSARATANYFASPSAGGSAHYIHDVLGEEHCVPEGTIAYHAPPNAHSIGDEVCGEASYTREQWLSPQVWPAVLASARRCREVCDRYGIPLVRLSAADLLAGRHGITGHVDVASAWHQSNHTDPGPGFPWPEYMAAVLAAGPAPTPAPTPVAPTGTPVVVPRPPVLTWCLPTGQWLGNVSGPANQHGGDLRYDSKAVHALVQNVQQWLIYRGCVPGVGDWRASGWDDGVWGDATDGPMRTWHARFYPGQPQPQQCWADDYRRLTA